MRDDQWNKKMLYNFMVIQVIMAVIAFISLTALALGLCSFVGGLAVKGGQMEGELNMGSQPIVNAERLAVSGTIGATQTSQYVGATSSGPPSEGSFETGDFVIDLSGNLWICSESGSPGNWVSVSAGGSNGLLPFVAVSGLNQSFRASRYIGATNGVDPQTFAAPYFTGDYVVDLTGDIWICTSGSNNSWQSIKNSLGSPVAPVNSITVLTLSGSSVTSNVFTVTGNSSALVNSRYVGGSMSGPPITGNYQPGDFAVDLTGDMWVYSSSSDWISVGAAGSYLALNGGTLTGSIFCTGTVDIGSSTKSFNSIYATQFFGAIQTSQQPQITSVGALQSLTMAGNVDMGSHSLINASSITSSAFVNTGVIGASANSRYIGATISGAPVSGSFSAGDFVIDQSGNCWIYTSRSSWQGLNAAGTYLPLAGGSLSGDLISSGNLGSSSQKIPALYATNITGTLQTASQPNITQVGVLFGLTLQGALNMGGYVITNISSASASHFDCGGITGATSASRYVGATSSGSPVSGTFQAGDVVVDQSGNLWIYTSGNTWQGLNAAGTYLPLSGGTLSGSLLVNPSDTVNLGTSQNTFASVYATNLWGTIQQASQPSITTLTAVTDLNGIVVGSGSLGAFALTGSISIVGNNLSIGTNVQPLNSLYVSSLTGTLQTASQPNVTSVGTLTSLSLSGDINLQGNHLLQASSLQVTGLTGATTTSRYVGATTSGAPVSGTFTSGDFVVDLTGNIWIFSSSWQSVKLLGSYVSTTGSTMTGDLLVSGSHNLGSSGSPWNQVFATSITGTLTTPIQTSITQVGTLSAGTWQASTVAVSYGGTGQTSLAANQLLFGNGTAGVGSVSSGATGTVLIGVSGSNPVFSNQPTVSSITISNAPVNTTDGANKAYVDSVVAGLTWKDTCACATTSNLNAVYNNGSSGVGATLTNSGTLAAFVTDGQSPVVNSRILVLSQSLTFQNGIYVLSVLGDGSTAWVLTRATDWNQPSQIQPGDIIPVQSGTTNGGTSWIQTASVTQVGTSAIIFSQFSYSAYTFLQVNNNLSELTASASTARTNLGITNLATQSVTTGQVLVGAAGNTLTGPTLTDGQLLIGSTGATPVATVPLNGTNISWSTGAGSLTANISGQVSVSNGGTGLSSATPYALVAGGTSSSGPLQSLPSLGNAGQVLTSQGASSLPTWSAVGTGSVTSITAGSNLTGGTITTTGTIALSSTLSGVTWNGSAIGLGYGGTGAALTASNGGIVYSTGSALDVLAGTASAYSLLLSGASAAPSWLAPTASAMLITNSGGVPSWSSTLPAATAGGSIIPSITNTYSLGSGTFTFASGYFTGLSVTGTTVNTLVYSDASKTIQSVSVGNGISFASGSLTANIDGSNLIFSSQAITTAQSILTTASPTFAALTLVSGSNNVKLNVSSGSVAYNFNLPISAGASGALLTSGGGGSTAMTWSTISSLAITSVTGTANQVLVNGGTTAVTSGSITLTTPQAIGTSSSPSFAGLTLSGAAVFNFSGGGAFQVIRCASGASQTYQVFQSSDGATQLGYLGTVNGGSVSPGLILDAQKGALFLRCEDSTANGALYMQVNNGTSTITGLQMTTSGALTTLYNTLEDGSGNMSVHNRLSSTTVQLSSSTTYTTSSIPLSIGGQTTSPIAGRMMWGDGTGWQLRMSTTLQNATSLTDLFYFQDNAYLGIGMSPNEPLDVSGNIRSSTGFLSGPLSNYSQLTNSSLGSYTTGGVLQTFGIQATSLYLGVTNNLYIGQGTTLTFAGIYAGDNTVFYVSTASLTNISSITASGYTYTVTTSSNHNLAVNQFVSISEVNSGGSWASSYNRVFQIMPTGFSSTTFQVFGTVNNPAAADSNTGNVRATGPVRTATNVLDDGFGNGTFLNGLRVGPNASTMSVSHQGFSQVTGLSNTSSRPALSTTLTGSYEYRSYSVNGVTFDDGFLRLSAGGGTSTATQSYIDLSGFSTISDMSQNIVFGTGSEIMRITTTGVILQVPISVPAGNKIYLSGSDTNHYIYSYGNAMYFGEWTGVFHFYDTSTSADRMTINGSNVGIGDSSPNCFLSVGGGSLTDTNVPVQISAGGVRRYFGANRSNGAYGLLVGWDTSFGGSTIRSINAADSLALVVNGGTQALTIIPSGAVGVGSTNPISPFFVIPPTLTNDLSSNYTTTASFNVCRSDVNLVIGGYANGANVSVIQCRNAGGYGGLSMGTSNYGIWMNPLGGSVTLGPNNAFYVNSRTASYPITAATCSGGTTVTLTFTDSSDSTNPFVGVSHIVVVDVGYQNSGSSYNGRFTVTATGGTKPSWTVSYVIGANAPDSSGGYVSAVFEVHTYYNTLDDGYGTAYFSGPVFIAGSSFNLSGGNNLLLTTTGSTSLTLPTSGTLATTANLSAYLPLVGGTMTGTIDMGNHQINNCSGLTIIPGSGSTTEFGYFNTNFPAGSDPMIGSYHSSWWCSGYQGGLIPNFATPSAPTFTVVSDLANATFSLIANNDINTCFYQYLGSGITVPQTITAAQLQSCLSFTISCGGIVKTYNTAGLSFGSGAPAARNTLDDGSGNMTIAGQFRSIGAITSDGNLCSNYSNPRLQLDPNTTQPGTLQVGTFDVSQASYAPFNYIHRWYAEQRTNGAGSVNFINASPANSVMEIPVGVIIGQNTGNPAALTNSVTLHNLGAFSNNGTTYLGVLNGTGVGLSSYNPLLCISAVTGGSPLGGVMQQSTLTAASTRPPITNSPDSSSTVGSFEYRGISASGPQYDDGFLRLSAGGGSYPASYLAYIDLSGYSTVSDMVNNIVLGIGSERMRITTTCVFLQTSLSVGFSNVTYPPTNGLFVSGVTCIGTSTPTNGSTPTTLTIKSTGNAYSHNEFDYPNALQLLSGTTTSDWTLYMGCDTTNHVSYIQSVNYLVAASNLSLNARGGNVGINLYNPAYPLDVSGFARATSVISNGLFSIVNNTNIPTATGAYLYMTSGYASPVLGRIYCGDGTGWKLYISYRAGSADTDLFTFYDHGKFGIFDTSPGSNLSVVGNAQIGFTSGTVAPSGGLVVNGQVGIGTTSFSFGAFTQISAPSANAICLLVSGLLTATTGQIGSYDTIGFDLQPTIKPSGTSSWAVPQYIYPNFDASLAAGTTISNSAGLFIGAGNLASGAITNSYGLYVYNPNFGTNSCTAYFQGKVGINNTNPSYLLDVNGITRVNGFIQGSETITGPSSLSTLDSIIDSRNSSFTVTLGSSNTDQVKIVRLLTRNSLPVVVSCVGGGGGSFLLNPTEPCRVLRYINNAWAIEVGNSATGSTSFFPTTQQGSSLVGSGYLSSTCSQGYSVAISSDGNTIAIGAEGDNGFQGAVWIYTRSGSTWTQQGSKLVGSGAANSAYQGSSVALSADGNTLAEGGRAETSGGAVWVFVRSGSTWSQQGSKLFGSGSVSSNQGISVALSADGNTLVSGASLDNSGVGAVWVFVRSSGSWSQQGSKIIPSDGISAYFGYSSALSADGNTMAVGGLEDNNQIGASWIFTRSGTSWTQQGSKLVGTNGSATALQGYSVSLSADGNVLAVGGPQDSSNAGGAWIFTRSFSNWTQQTSKFTVGGTGQLGNSVTLSADGNTLVCGYGQNNSSNNVGVVFLKIGNSWIQQTSLSISDAVVTNTPFAVALSSNGSTLVAGCYYFTSRLGATWVFT